MFFCFFVFLFFVFCFLFFFFFFFFYFFFFFFFFFLKIKAPYSSLLPRAPSDSKGKPASAALPSSNASSYDSDKPSGMRQVVRIFGLFIFQLFFYFLGSKAILGISQGIFFLPLFLLSFLFELFTQQTIRGERRGSTEPMEGRVRRRSVGSDQVC